MRNSITVSYDHPRGYKLNIREGATRELITHTMQHYHWLLDVLAGDLDPEADRDRLPENTAELYDHLGDNPHDEALVSIWQYNHTPLMYNGSKLSAHVFTDETDAYAFYQHLCVLGDVANAVDAHYAGVSKGQGKPQPAQPSQAPAPTSDNGITPYPSSQQREQFALDNDGKLVTFVIPVLRKAGSDVPGKIKYAFFANKGHQFPAFYLDTGKFDPPEGVISDLNRLQWLNDTDAENLLVECNIKAYTTQHGNQSFYANPLSIIQR